MNNLDPHTTKVLAVVHDAAGDKLAREPVALDVRDVTVMTDVIYVCHGDSTKAVEAIAASITAKLEAADLDPLHVEGLAQSQWVLLDLGPVMVHVFLKERREYYSLERLWHDARPIALPAA